MNIRGKSRSNILILLGVLFCAALFVLIVGGPGGKEKTTLTLDRLLGWVPRDSELVCVSKGPFGPVPGESLKDLSLLAWAKLESLPSFHGRYESDDGMGNKSDDLMETLLGSHYCVLAATAFLDGVHIEGSRTVLLEPGNKETQKYIGEHYSAVAGYGLPVWQKTYTYICGNSCSYSTMTATRFFCFPSPELLLVGEGENGFRASLARIEQNAPPGLPEPMEKLKKEISMDGPFWAIRYRIKPMQPFSSADGPLKEGGGPSSLTVAWAGQGKLQIRLHGACNVGRLGAISGFKFTKVGDSYEGEAAVGNSSAHNAPPINVMELLTWHFLD